jgi:adenine C2-methylase RlmN of 23S rRNA A2503 and tRNA A37
MPRERKLSLRSVWDSDIVLEAFTAAGIKSKHTHQLYRRLLAREDKYQETKEIPELDSKAWLPNTFLDFPVAAKELLLKDFQLFTTKIVERKDSDGLHTTKLLVRLQDGNVVESVIIRHEGRNTLCVSSQVGCAMGCRFCATGTLGLLGHLTAGEILEQLVHANRIEKIRNVVFMGMGEPLDNLAAVLSGKH